MLHNDIQMIVKKGRILQSSNKVEDKLLHGKNQILTNEDVKDNDFKELLQLLYSSMNLNGGIGIAAPQIGICKRLAIVHPEFTQSEGSEYLRILINATYKPVGRDKWIQDEGCLSVKNGTRYKPKARYLQIDVTNDIINSNNQLKTERFLVTVFLARIIQHEKYNLNCKLFID